MTKLPVVNIEGKETDNISVPADVFGGRVNTHVLHQALVMYQAALRQGNASTKERADVSGGGKKPWRQKGTGRARQGSIRSPLWHKGGVVFGPHPRDFSYSLPKKIKQAALRESLNAKIQTKNLLCVDDFSKPMTKTKEFAQILKKLNLNGKILAILEGSDKSIERVSRNIPRFNIMRTEDVNAFDVLKNKRVLITKTAFKKLLNRIK